MNNLNLSLIDGVILLILGIGVLLLTYFTYPPLIKWLYKKKYIGKDIHKHSRPEVAESGGLGLTIGLIIGLLIVGIIFNEYIIEVVIFIVMIAIAACVGWYDDRKQLSSFKKIAFMFLAGLPLLIADLPWLQIVDIQNPTLPIIGTVRLTYIYPFLLPVIIMVMSNTMNMLEGYNGEGSGTSGIAMFFLLIISILNGSDKGLIFSIPVFAAIGAFFLFNKFPAKVFPGDIGTLVIGVSVSMVALYGGLEFYMIICFLPHIFNSFYYIASMHGFTESHDITVKDIYMDEENNIFASREKKAPLTLPRLILAFGKLKEPQLVHNFFALSIVSGLFGIIICALSCEINLVLQIILIIGSILLIGYTVYKYPRSLGLVLIMIFLFLAGGLLFLFIRDVILTNIGASINWLAGFAIGGLLLGIWYLLTIWHFNVVMKKKKDANGKNNQEEGMK